MVMYSIFIITRIEISTWLSIGIQGSPLTLPMAEKLFTVQTKSSPRLELQYLGWKTERRKPMPEKFKILSDVPETEKYLRLKIAQKKAHVRNEQKRVRILEGLLAEVLRKRGAK